MISDQRFEEIVSAVTAAVGAILIALIFVTVNAF